jgi:hypothetical protein
LSAALILEQEGQRAQVLLVTRGHGAVPVATVGERVSANGGESAVGVGVNEGGLVKARVPDSGDDRDAASLASSP